MRRAAVPDTGFHSLKRPVPPRTALALQKHLQALLRWQADLRRWPLPAPRQAFPDATPFVSLHSARGTLGCMGSHEGEPRERVARAFLLALHDARFPMVTPAERGELTCELSYAHSPVRVGLLDFAARYEAGKHGVCAVHASGKRAVLFPSVAYDGVRSAAHMLEALARKGGAELLPTSALYLFGASHVVVRSRRDVVPPDDDDTRDMAAAWLAGSIMDDGAVVFSVDARTAVGTLSGASQHARAAVVVKALLRHGTFVEAALRARARLTRDIREGLRGKAVAGFPSAPPEVAGMLALACWSGAPLERELLAAAKTESLAGVPWYAAQVVLALRESAPSVLWEACVADLAKTPWAPWTAMAAHALEQYAIYNQCATTLAKGLRDSAPYQGAFAPTAGAVPEVALTAIAVEALALRPRHPSFRAARDRGRAFLRRTQLTSAQTPACVDPRTARGAFPITPSLMMLRADVTAHALLALL